MKNLYQFFRTAILINKTISLLLLVFAINVLSSFYAKDQHVNNLAAFCPSIITNSPVQAGQDIVLTVKGGGSYL